MGRGRLVKGSRIKKPLVWDIAGPRGIKEGPASPEHSKGESFAPLKDGRKDPG
jgi:hypothetical protein